MNQILVDGIMAVAFHHGVLRIDCGTIDREGKLSLSGSLMIPGAQAGVVLQSIANAARELEKRGREKAAKAAAEPAKADTPPVEH